jgi:hypothetical protein
VRLVIDLKADPVVIIEVTKAEAALVNAASKAGTAFETQEAMDLVRIGEDIKMLHGKLRHIQPSVYIFGFPARIVE